MIAPTTDLRTAVANAVAAYEASGNMGVLMERLHALRDGATADALVAAVEPWREMPEVAGPIYERIVAEQPGNARALVILANAYWLSGRGPEVVGALADRAIAADPNNRGAWHMWALTEGNQRDRTIRWLQVTERFPEDQLAKAALADNASSLASAEHDKEAMQLAIRTYEQLLAMATSDQQKQALESALTTLRKWTI
jgi:tetratricopeptide (TPR) repeat protein